MLIEFAFISSAMINGSLFLLAGKIGLLFVRQQLLICLCFSPSMGFHVLLLFSSYLSTKPIKYRQKLTKIPLNNPLNIFIFQILLCQKWINQKLNQMRSLQKNSQMIIGITDIEDPSSLSIRDLNSQMDRLHIIPTLPNQRQKSMLGSSQLNVFGSTQSVNERKSRNTFHENFFKQNKLGLKKVVTKQKVKGIIENVKKKLRRNITAAEPVQFQPFNKGQSQGFLSKKGLIIPSYFDLSFSFLSVIQILLLCFVYTLALVFEELIQSEEITTLQTFSMFFYSVQIVINFISIKTVQGKRLFSIREIATHYFRKKFIIDIVCLIVLIVDINGTYIFTNFLRLCVVLKLKQCLQKLQKIQTFFLNNFYREQYWSLVKVFLINFGFAHILAILLIAMAGIQNSKEQNWMQKFEIQDDSWYEKYVWAYYWGSTIMLTVGFGDISPANFKQAICLTLIETFSCVLLAYNINCVGNLINNIRSQDTTRTANFKTMRRLAEENEINEELEWKICNYIDQSDKIKKRFKFQADKEFVFNLPYELKAQFLKQSNKKIFQHLSFFQNLTKKTLLGFAQQIEVKIAHPQEILFRLGDNNKFIILRNGKVGYCTKDHGSDFNKTVIDVLKVKKGNSPKLLYLNFLNGYKDVKFEIKALEYSVISQISEQKAVQIMKNCAYDFETYCQMKDKSKHIIDELELLQCQYCPTKHSKMKCPKLHYIPFNQNIIHKYHSKLKNSKAFRKPFSRSRYRKTVSSLLSYKKQFQSLYIMIFGSPQPKMHQSMKKSKTQKNLRSFKRNLSIKQIKQFDNIFEQQQNKFEILLAEALSEMKKNGSHSDFWGLQTDELHNYKFYFTEFNVNLLQDYPIFFQSQGSDKIVESLFDFSKDSKKK